MNLIEVEAVDIPVWVDVDTGYNNFQRTVSEFEKIGVDGVCIEDNVPELKINSLWGEQIPLLSMEEFAKKLQVKRNKIRIIARTESIVRGFGWNVAIDRLTEYIKYAEQEIIED